MCAREREKEEEVEEELNKADTFKSHIILIICNITVLAETYKHAFSIGTRANTNENGKHNIYLFSIII